MDPNDLRLLALLQGGLPLDEDPFGPAARALGTTPDSVLERLRSLLSAGAVRRFGARLDQHRLGLRESAVIAWRLEPWQAEAAGAALAARPEVTHCYERRGVPGCWEYTLFAVIHAQDRAILERTADDLSGLIGCDDRVLLVSSDQYMRRPAARIEGAV
jgi:DNA-binding Lrp family transcriptional regulator